MQSCGCLSVQHTTETVYIWLPHNGMGSTVSDLKPSAAQNHLLSSTVDSIPFCHCSGSAIAEHFTALIQILMSAGSMHCTSQWLASSTQTISDPSMVKVYIYMGLLVAVHIYVHEGPVGQGPWAGRGRENYINFTSSTGLCVYVSL